MNRILIVGEHSYVGDSLMRYLDGLGGYSVRKMSVRQPCWKEECFGDIDVIYYVAAIVHCNENSITKEEYYRVNCRLPFEVALKAKEEGVRQFIFVSSMSIYGMLTGCIDANTIPRPCTLYGKSKLQAEEELDKLSSEDFSVVVLRPPMIYGKECRGNFRRLQSLALRCPVFPAIENKRSMLYIENLNILVEQIIRYRKKGVFFPQDAELVCTWEMVRLIREKTGKRIHGIRILNPLIRSLQHKCSSLQKIWGSLYYTSELSRIEGITYQKYTLSEAINDIVRKD